MTVKLREKPNNILCRTIESSLTIAFAHSKHGYFGSSVSHGQSTKILSELCANECHMIDHNCVGGCVGVVLCPCTVQEAKAALPVHTDHSYCSVQ